MAIASFEKVLQEARELPFHAQNQLVETLLNEAERSFIKPTHHEINGSALEMLSGLSLGELQTLADAVLAPTRQRRLRSLLRKKKASALSDKESKELDGILEDSDRLALLKAKAKYTLLHSEPTGGAAT